MKNISAILDKLLAIAKDVKVWFRIFVLVVTGFVGAIAFSKTKIKKEGCDACTQQLSGVIQFLNTMKSEMATENTDTIITKSITPAAFILADTTPINKKRISKIDSLLRRIDLFNKKSKT